MIRSIFRYRLNLPEFLNDLPSFVRDWCVSRRWWLMLAGSPAVLLSAILFSIFLYRWLDVGRDQLGADYQKLAFAAIEAGQVVKADVYMARTIELASDRSARSFEISKLLYERGHEAKALEILSALAPLRQQGYVPAHRFLAQHWFGQKPATDVTTVIAMYHDMHAQGLAEEPRLKLASLLSDRGYQDHAAGCLTTLLHPSPSARLQLFQIYTRANRHRAAKQHVERAEQDLRAMLKESPAQDDVRVLLAKTIACQDRVLDAIYVLADGCEGSAPPVVVDQLVRLYVVWLSRIAEAGADRQLRELAMVLDPEKEPAEKQSAAQLEFSSGRQVTVPAVIAELHASLVAGNGNWLIPVLQGASFAAQKEYELAVERLQLAVKYRPEHPVIANNLAWALMKRHEQLKEKMLANAESEEIQHAWKLANSAVAHLPGEPSFLETRGQIAGIMGQWDAAVSDLNECLSLGYDTPAIRKMLAMAKKKNL